MRRFVMRALKDRSYLFLRNVHVPMFPAFFFSGLFQNITAGCCSNPIMLNIARSSALLYTEYLTFWNIAVLFAMTPINLPIKTESALQSQRSTPPKQGCIHLCSSLDSAGQMTRAESF